MQNQAIGKNPQSSKRVNRGISGALTTQGATDRLPRQSSSLDRGEALSPFSPSQQTSLPNSFQLAQTLDLLLLELRDRLAQIEEVGDRELPNLKIFVNNQEVYHRVNGVPQKLPAQIDSEDISYLARAIDLSEGTRDMEMNRDIQIKVDGKVVFELVAGEVITNLIQGQRDQVSSAQTPVDSSVLAIGSDDSEVSAKEGQLEGTEQIAKNIGYALTLFSSMDELLDGEYSLMEGVDVKKETDPSGNSRTIISDARDIENTQKYCIEKFSNGDLTFNDIQGKEILSFEAGKANVFNLDPSSETLIQEIESFISQQSIDFMRGEDPEVNPMIVSQSPDLHLEDQTQSKKLDKQDEIDF